MAHKVQLSFPKKTRPGKFSLPNIAGRVGISFYVGTKEVFLGVAISDVVLETVTRRRVAKISKAQTRTFGFDPLGGNTED